MGKHHQHFQEPHTVLMSRVCRLLVLGMGTSVINKVMFCFTQHMRHVWNTTTSSVMRLTELGLPVAMRVPLSPSPCMP